MSISESSEVQLQSVDADLMTSVQFSCSDDIDEYEKSDGAVDAYGKLAKNRERNREHAKRTRLRKKALMEGMKGKLLELQTEATRLQQAFEEQNTANILLCLTNKDQGEGGGDSTLIEKLKLESSLDVPTIKGNIIDQLRTRVRCEAAKQKRPAAALLKARSNSIALGANEGSLSPAKRPRTGSITSRNPDSTTEDVTKDVEDDLDSEAGEEVDPDTIQPLPKSVVNWKNGTVSSEDGVVRKLSDEEMEYLRKERNRIHAKLTRDRKKLFTSRMQQMINTLERQNIMLRNRLKNVVEGAATLIPGPTQALAIVQENRDANGGFDDPKNLGRQSMGAASQLPAHLQIHNNAQFQSQLLQHIHPQLLSMFPMSVGASGYSQCPSVLFGGMPVNVGIGVNGMSMSNHPQQMVTITLPVPVSAVQGMAGMLPPGIQRDAILQLQQCHGVPTAVIPDGHGGMVALAAPSAASLSASTSSNDLSGDRSSRPPSPSASNSDSVPAPAPYAFIPTTHVSIPALQLDSASSSDLKSSSSSSAQGAFKPL